MVRPWWQSPSEHRSGSRKGGKPARRPRRYRISGLLEGLEQRIAPAVDVNLTAAGLLSVSLSDSDDAVRLTTSTPQFGLRGQLQPRVQVFANDVQVASYSSSQITGVQVIGAEDEDDQSVTISGTWNLSAGLLVDNLASVVFNGGSATRLRASSIDVSASSIEVQAGATLHTRQISALGDPKTATSTGPSGPITLTAPSITVQDRARLLAHATGSFAAGDVTMQAEKTDFRTWTPGIGTLKLTDAVTSINVGAAEITGDDIRLTATSSTTEEVELTDDLADDTRAIAVADFDGDGRPDLVTGNRGGVSRLYLNNGSDTPLQLVAARDVGESLLTTALVAGDVNADGRPDLVVGGADGLLHLLINNGTSDPFAGVAPVALTAPGSIGALSLADFNGDGRLDLMAGSDNGPGRLYLHDGTASPFQATWFDVTPTLATTALAAADFDGDGRVDLAVGIDGQDALLYRNAGSLEGPMGNPFGGTSGAAIAKTFGSTAALAAADMNGDGRPDLVVVRSGAAPLLVLNNGTAQPFDLVQPTDIGSDTYESTAVAAADLDGDGALDLVVANNDGPVRIFTNRLAASEGFDAEDAHDEIQQAWAVGLADLDGDGALDLVIGNGAPSDGGTNQLSVAYLNTGEGDDPFLEAEAQIVTPEDELATPVTESDAGLLDFLSETSLMVAGLFVMPTATVALNSGALLNARGDVLVRAAANAEASMTTLGAYLGINFAKAAPVASVTMSGASRIDAGGSATLWSETWTDLSMATYVASLGAVGNLVVSYARTDGSSGVSVGAGSSITAGNVTVAAKNTDTISQTASAYGFQSSGAAGIGATIVVGDYDSTTTATVAGSITAQGSVLISAESERPTNVTRASASVLDPMQNKPGVGRFLSWAGKELTKASSTQGVGNQILDGQGKAPKLSLSAALVVSDSDNVVRAAVEAGGFVSAAGGVDVIADAVDDFQAGATASSGNAEKLSIGGAVVVALTDNTAEAVIGESARVDALGLTRVIAEARRPRAFELFNLELSLPDGETPNNSDQITNSYDDGVSAAEALGLALDGLSVIFTGMLLGEVSTTLVHSGASTDKDDSVGIGVGVTFLQLDNRATATIGTNARINQGAGLAGGAGQDVVVRAAASTSTLNVAGQASALNFLNGFGSSGDKGAFGGSGTIALYDNEARASIGDGAMVRAGGDVSVLSDAFHYDLSIAQAGARSEEYGIEGSVSFFDLDGTSEAWIEDSALVIAGDTVLVRAEQELFLVNGTGGLAIGGTVGVGISGSVNVVDLDTRAWIGDTNDTTPGSTGLVQGKDVRVEADLDAQYWTISLAGAVQTTFPDGSTTAADTDAFVADEYAESGFEDTGESPLGSRTAGFGLSGAAAFNWLDETTEAFIADAGLVVAQDLLSVTAESDGLYVAGSGGWALADGLGVGGAFAVTRLDQDTKAYTRDVVLVARSLTIGADADNRLITAAAGAAGAKKTAAVAGSLGFVWLETETEAALRSGTTAELEGPASITATDHLDHWTVAGALGATEGTESRAAVGAAVALDLIDQTTRAGIDAGASLTSVATTGNIVVSAVNEQNIYTIGAAIAASLQAGVGAAGAAGATRLDTTVEAAIGAGASVLTPGTVYVNAHNDLDLLIVGGAAAGGKSDGVGLSVGLGLMDRTVRASVGQGAIVDAGGESVAADPDGSGQAGRGLILDATVTEDLFLFGAGIAGAAEGAAVAASAAVAVMDSTTEAVIGQDARINERIAPGSHPEQSVRLRAEHDTSTLGVAGAFEGAPEVGLGLAAAYLDIDRTVRADIGRDALVLAAADVRLEAETTGDTIAVAAAIGGSGSAAIEASAVVIEADNTTTAAIGDGAIVTAVGSVVLTADHVSTIDAGTGAGGIGLSGGFGISNVTLIGTDTTRATVGANARVTAHGERTPIGVYIGEQDADDERANRLVNGVALSATSESEILSIAIGAAGGGSAGVAGSVTVSEIDRVTEAYLGAGSVTESRSGQVVVAAADRLELDAGAGQIGLSGAVGVGAGADVGLIEKTTRAYIDADASVEAGGDVVVRAYSEDEILSVAGAFSVGLSTGIAMSASGYDLDLVTHAFIGERATVVSDTNVVVAARADLEMDAVAGSLSAGKASVGASAAVVLVDQDTQAYISRDAEVTALGNGPGAAVDSGTFVTSYTPFGGGDQTRPPTTTNNSLWDTSFRFDAETEPTYRIVQGVAVSAVATTKLQTFAVSGSGGIGTVNLVGGVVLPEVTTVAYIGDNARINQDSAGAHPDQSVLLTAGTHWYHLNVAGTHALAAGAVNPGVAAVESDVTTLAFISTGARVQAAGDVAVTANTNFHAVLVGAGVSVTGAAVTGGVGVADLDHTTHAYIGGGAIVSANGNVLVAADDRSTLTSVAGSAALSGGTGVGASVGVLKVAKDARAYIGVETEVTALGQTTRQLTAFTGTMTNGTLLNPETFATSLVRGLAVQASSVEEIFTIAASGSLSTGGAVAGAVTVQLIGSNTYAYIADDARINADLAGAAADQAVHLAAVNDTNVKAYDGVISLGTTVGGVAGGIDVGLLRNDTQAWFGPNVLVQANQDVTVRATADRNIASYAVSVGTGLVGLAAGVTAWSIGGTLSDEARTALTPTSGDALAEAIDEEISIDDLTGLLTDYSSETDAGAHLQAIGEASLEGTGTDRLATALSSSPQTETAARVGPGAVVSAGRSLTVAARELIEVDAVSGGGVIGLLASIGGSVTSVTIDSTTVAEVQPGAVLEAGPTGTILVGAYQDNEVRGNSYGGRAGGVASLGAQVSLIEDNSAVSAALGEGVEVWRAGTLIVIADTDRLLDAYAGGADLSAGLTAGASITRAEAGGSTSATLGANTRVGQQAGLAVGGVLVIADVFDEIFAATFAVTVGIGSGTGNEAIARSTPAVTASIGQGSRVTVGTGDVALSATARADLYANTFGVGVAGLTVGVSISEAEHSPTVTTEIGANAVVTSGRNVSLTATSVTDLNVEGEASGGGAVVGNGSDVDAIARPVVTVRLDDASDVHAEDSVWLTALATLAAEAEADGISIGALTVGVSLADVTVEPEVHVIVDEGAELTARNDIFFSARANSTTGGLNATADSSVGTLLGGLGSRARVTLTPETSARVNRDARVDAGGVLEIFARDTQTAKATADGGAFGGVTYGSVFADAYLNRPDNTEEYEQANALAFVGEGASLEGRFVRVLAESSHTIETDAYGGAGGLISAGGTSSELEVEPATRVHVLGDIRGIELVRVRARGRLDADAFSDSLSIGGIALNEVENHVVGDADVATWIGAGVRIDAPDVSIRAIQEWLDIGNHAKSIAGGAGVDTRAITTTDVTNDVRVDIRHNAQITAFDILEIEGDTTKLFVNSFSEADAYGFGVPTAEATTNFTGKTGVTLAQGATLTGTDIRLLGTASNFVNWKANESYNTADTEAGTASGTVDDTPLMRIDGVVRFLSQITESLTILADNTIDPSSTIGATVDAAGVTVQPVVATSATTPFAALIRSRVNGQHSPITGTGRIDTINQAIATIENFGDRHLNIGFVLLGANAPTFRFYEVDGAFPRSIVAESLLAIVNHQDSNVVFTDTVEVPFGSVLVINQGRDIRNGSTDPNRRIIAQSLDLQAPQGSIGSVSSPLRVTSNAGSLSASSGRDLYLDVNRYASTNIQQINNQWVYKDATRVENLSAPGNIGVTLQGGLGRTATQFVPTLADYEVVNVQAGGVARVENTSRNLILHRIVADERVEVVTGGGIVGIPTGWENVTAPEASFATGTGIDLLRTQVQTLAARSTSGPMWFLDMLSSGTWTVGAVGSVEGLQTQGDIVLISPRALHLTKDVIAGSLRLDIEGSVLIGADITSGGLLDIDATGSLAISPGAVLSVDGSVQIDSNRSIFLGAGALIDAGDLVRIASPRALYLEAGSTVRSESDVILLASGAVDVTGALLRVDGEVRSKTRAYLQAGSVGTGHLIDLNGSLFAPSAEVVAAIGVEVVNVKRVAPGSTVQVSSRFGVNPRVNVGNGGTLTGIEGTLVLGLNDSLTGRLDVTIDSSAARDVLYGTLSSTELTGLGLGTGVVRFSPRVRSLELLLGSVGDSLLVNSTGARTTRIVPGAGDDTVTIVPSGLNGPTEVFAPGDTVVLQLATSPTLLATQLQQLTVTAALLEVDAGSLTAPTQWSYDGQTLGADNVALLNATGLSGLSLVGGLSTADRLQVATGFAGDQYVEIQPGNLSLKALNSPTATGPVFFHQGVETIVVNTEGGNDQVKVVGTAPGTTFLIDTRGGNDTIVIWGVGASGANNSNTVVQANAGSGNDYFDIDNPNPDAIVVAIPGPDTNTVDVKRTAARQATTVQIGQGADTVQVKGSRLQSNLTVRNGSTARLGTVVFDTENATIDRGRSTLTAQGTPAMPSGQIFATGAAGGLVYVNLATLDVRAKPTAQIQQANFQNRVTMRAGQSLNLSAVLNVRPSVYQWDLNNDGQFDFTAPSLNLSWTQLRNLGLNRAGEFTIRLRVTDDLGNHSEVTATLVILASFFGGF